MAQAPLGRRPGAAQARPGAAQAPLPSHRPKWTGRRRVQVRRAARVAVALRDVHRLFRAAEQRRAGRNPTRGEDHLHADGDGDVHGADGRGDGTADRLHDAVGLALRDLAGDETGEEQGELVAAQACHQVIAPRARLAKPRRDDTQDVVAGGQPVLEVDLREPVEVEDHQRAPVEDPAPHPAQLAPERTLPPRARRELGDIVDIRFAIAADEDEHQGPDDERRPPADGQECDGQHPDQPDLDQRDDAEVLDRPGSARQSGTSRRGSCR